MPPSNPSPPMPPPPVNTPVHQVPSALPAHFRSNISLEGLPASNLQTLGAELDVAIKEQVVATLNNLRLVWDPDWKFPCHYFQRQIQTFPEVLLADENNRDIRLGIELKVWYLLEEPNFCFTATAAACGPKDLLCIVPWYLSNGFSGVPVVSTLFAVQAQYAASHRNWWWRHGRDTWDSTAIESPAGVKPYPGRQDQIQDRPVCDGEGMFGHLARTGLWNGDLDAYIKRMLDLPLSGIPARRWIRFLANAQF